MENFEGSYAPHWYYLLPMDFFAKHFKVSTTVVLKNMFESLVMCTCLIGEFVKNDDIDNKASALAYSLHREQNY